MGKRQFSIVSSLILKCESKPSFEALVCGRLANNSGHYHAAVWAGGAGLRGKHQGSGDGPGPLDSKTFILHSAFSQLDLDTYEREGSASQLSFFLFSNLIDRM